MLPCGSAVYSYLCSVLGLSIDAIGSVRLGRLAGTQRGVAGDIGSVILEGTAGEAVR